MESSRVLNRSPVISGTPTGDVTEDVILTTGGLLSIADVDAGQSNFAPQPGTSGSFGTFTLTAGGAWTYTLNNSLPAIQQLGAGQSLTDSFTAFSSDGTGSPKVIVTIHGNNDLPLIRGRPTLDLSAALFRSTGGLLSIADVDAGQSNFAPQPGTSGSFGTFALTAGGAWTYTLNNSLPAIQQLGAGQS